MSQVVLVGAALVGRRNSRTLTRAGGTVYRSLVQGALPILCVGVGLFLLIRVFSLKSPPWTSAVPLMCSEGRKQGCTRFGPSLLRSNRCQGCELVCTSDSPEALLAVAATYLQSQPRTRLEGVATGEDLQHFTAASQWVGFVDDIAIFAYPVGTGVTGLATQMQLRIGSGDMKVIHTHILTHTNSNTHTNTHTHKLKHTHTHIHIHTHTHTHTHT
jgi:hypothetical protein